MLSCLGFMHYRWRPLVWYTSVNFGSYFFVLVNGEQFTPELVRQILLHVFWPHVFWPHVLTVHLVMMIHVYVYINRGLAIRIVFYPVETRPTC